MRRSLCALWVAVAGCGQPGGPGYFDEGLMVCAKGPTIEGVDVSHYDGAIDWAAAHGAGIDFAFMKATESTDFTDPTFATNWKAAGENGVVRGAYHFFRPAVDATMQADFFVATAGMPAPGDLPLTLDLETTDNLSAAEVAKGALAFLNRVEQLTGRTPIVYTSASFFNGTLASPAGFDHYILWVAHWTNMCPNVPNPTWTDWLFWQYADNGKVAGINSMVDRDKFNGTLADLQSFVAGAVASDGGTAIDAGDLSDAAPMRQDLSRAADSAIAVDGAGAARSVSGCACALGGGKRPPPATLVLLLLLGLSRAARRRIRAEL